MNVLHSSEKIIRDCCRTGEEVTFVASQNSRRVDNALQRKIRILEFYIAELASEKDRLAVDIVAIKSISSRIEQTVKSLQYPKDTNLKCTEIRSVVPELRNDDVQNELNKEIELLEETRTFFSNLLEELREQLRKNRSTVFSLEDDLERKMTSLNAEKKNDSLTETDLSLSDPKENYNLAHTNVSEWNSVAREISENWQNVEWIRSTRKLLDRGKQELENGQKLVNFAEESLSSKTTALLNRYNCCNESFHKRIAQCKSVKRNLELELLNINELIHRLRKCIDETQNTITANEPEERVSKLRLQKRIASNNPELLNDIVQLTLIENLQRQSKTLEILRAKFKTAKSSSTSLIKMKNQLETEIEDKITAIKIDEVECLSARSSIHYHAY